MANIEKRISKDGEISYRVKVRIKGYASQSATFERLSDARKWEQQTEAAMREGRHFKTTAAKKHTVGELITRYLKQLEKQNSKRHHDVKPKLDWWKTQIGHSTLADVSKSTIAEKRELLITEQLGKGKKKWTRTPATANRYMTVLSHLFTVAVNEWELLEAQSLIWLLHKGRDGVTAQEISSWALRLGAYVFLLRHDYNLNIITIREPHDGGYHARYVLKDDVEIVRFLPSL